MAAGAAPPPVRRSRKRLWIVLALLLAALLALRWVSQPSRIAWIALSQAGRALDLEIGASGASEYRLRGTPMLEVRDVVARRPGSDKPLLRAGRVYLALPWATIRAAGASLDIERIELDAPQLDIDELNRWLAARPPSSEPLQLPRLSRGARVRDGRAYGEGWSVDAIGIEFAELDPERALRGRVRGRALASGVAVPFDLAATLHRPAAARGLGLAGAVAVETKDWRLPMRLRAGARLHAGDDGLGLDALRLGANARYRATAGNGAASDLPFAFGVAGPLRYRDGELAVAPVGVALRAAADSAIPNLDAGGRFAFGETLRLHWQGRIHAWPQAWPALPPPLGQSTEPLSLQLDYAGKADLSDTAALRAQRGPTRFDGRFRLPEMLAWIDAQQASPLPPLSGELSTPKIEISGATLEGVQVRIEDDPPAASTPAPRTP